VTSLRDGMNVVAKEFVAAQNPDDPGVLVLSRFAGAAEQLSDALLVNPNDPEALTEALDTALRMDLAARRAHWNRLWRRLILRSAHDWSVEFLAALEEAAADRASPPRQGVAVTTPNLRLAGPPIAVPSRILPN
jgi:trehalose 6-phosphate synthase